MKKFLLIPFLIFFCLLAVAQQNHFIYLQTENKQPFYIKLDNKVLNSSPSGYLIISKLSEGVYKLIIGFPKNEWPEQELICKVEKKDVGYILKNTDNKNWSLFNLQTGATTLAGEVVQKTQDAPLPKLDDPFSIMLANVVNDSTILQKDVVTDEPKEKTVDKKPEETKKEIKTPDVVITESIPKSVIIRKFKKSSKDGLNLMYTDESESGIDTIRIIIPMEKVEKKKDENIVQEKPGANNSETVINKTDNNTQAPITSEKNDQQKAIPEVVIKEDKKEVPVSEEKKDVPSAVKSSMINSDCKAIASDEDFFKLRKKMASENTSENMIKVAKKFFKSKCFSTENIKNLSALFLTDDGRYLFFDAAYPYVSDSDAFPMLEKQLIDQYYVTRFRAMIHH